MTKQTNSKVFLAILIVSVALIMMLIIPILAIGYEPELECTPARPLSSNQYLKNVELTVSMEEDVLSYLIHNNSDFCIGVSVVNLEFFDVLVEEWFAMPVVPMVLPGGMTLFFSAVFISHPPNSEFGGRLDLAHFDMLDMGSEYRLRIDIASHDSTPAKLHSLYYSFIW